MKQHLLIFLLLAMAVTAVPLEKSYFVPLHYDNGIVTRVGDPYVVSGPGTDDKSTQGYQAALYDADGNKLATRFFMFPLFLSPVTLPEDIGTPPVILTEADYTLVMPYHSEGAVIRLIDPTGKEIDSIDVSSLALCNQNGKCDGRETEKNCPEDCSKGQMGPIIKVLEGKPLTPEEEATFVIPPEKGVEKIEEESIKDEREEGVEPEAGKPEGAKPKQTVSKEEAQFAPMVSEPATTTSYWWLWIIIVLVVVGVYYWRKTKPVEYETKKHHEEVKWVGKEKKQWWWIIPVAVIAVGFLLWSQQESSSPAFTVPDELFDDDLELGQVEEPLFDAEEGIAFEEEQKKPVETPKEEEKPVPEEEEPVEEQPEEKSATATMDDAEAELAATKNFMTDLFKALARAKDRGEDIAIARKIYNEANAIYYRGTLALKNGRYDEAVDLALEAREKAEDAKAEMK
ncbi:hypothetical protein HY639_04435 [Candidatus Woesearchaeota archaeon]|nr:hypothetical protein [Candidatus Woesearchaeota archaeon]